MESIRKGLWLALALILCFALHGVALADNELEDDFWSGSICYEVIAPAATGIPGEVMIVELATGIGPVDVSKVTEWGFEYKVTAVGETVFSGSSVTSVSLPEVTTIGPGAFWYCGSLRSVNLPKATLIVEGAFDDCGALTSVNLPEATQIGQSAFFSCSSLASISLPKATVIGQSAFEGCEKLIGVDLPNATLIYENAFSRCTALTSVSLPNAIMIGANAFGECNSLTSISLPKATQIGAYAFTYCQRLVNVNLPKATRIGECAFERCEALTSVSLPKATQIEAFAFAECQGLINVDLPSATQIGSAAFSGCWSLTGVSLPKATQIGGAAFSGCQLLARVELPNATIIGANAFSDCIALTSVDLPNAIQIGENAFVSCSVLTSAALPKATRLGDGAFRNCGSLAELTMGARILPGNFPESAFDDARPINVHVPNAMVTYYQQYLSSGANQRFAGGSKIIGDMSRPSVSGGNDLSGRAGGVGALTIEVALQGCYEYNETISLTANIGGKTAKASRAEDGEVSFYFKNGDLDTLGADLYDIKVYAPATLNNMAIPATVVGQLAISEAQPSVSGANLLQGYVGAVGAQVVRAVVEDSFPEKLNLTATIGGKTATASRTGDGDIAFLFNASDLNALSVGAHPITVSARATASNSAISETSVGALIVGTPSAGPAPAATIRTLQKIYLVRGKTLMLPCSDGSSVTWTSANKKIASVSAIGKVKGLKAGKSTVITVMNANSTALAQTRVHVVRRAKKLKSLSITPSTPASLSIGQTLQIVPRLSPASATGIVPKYTTTNSSVAEVDALGLVTGKGVGQALITVKAGAKKKTLIVTVH